MNTLSVLRLFANKQFLRLWIIQIVIQIAINMTNYTVLLLVVQKTHNTLTQAEFYAIITIPAVLFGFFAGPTVEIVERKKMLLITTISFFALFLLYVISGNTLFILFCIAFLISSLARFFVPATLATIPFIVKEDLLEEANSIFLFTLLSSVLVGYTISSPIIDLFGGLGGGGEKAPFILAALFAAGGGILAYKMTTIRKEIITVPPGTMVKSSFLLFLQTLQKVKSDKLILTALGLLTFIELNIGMVTVVLLEYISQYLLLPVTMVTYVLIIPFVIGLILGSIFLRPLEKRFGKSQSIIGSCLAIGILFIIFGILPLLLEPKTFVFLLRLVSSLSAMLVGVAIVLVSVHARTILQTHAPLSMQGRVFSFLDILISLITPVPVLFLGFFAQAVSLLSALQVYGVVIVGGIGYYYLRHRNR